MHLKVRLREMMKGAFSEKVYVPKRVFVFGLETSLSTQDKVSNILSFLCLLILLDSSGDAT